MLTQSRVLNYIKDNVGFPFSHLEFDDDQLLDYFTTYSLREFSHYFPYTEKVYLNLLADSNKVPGIQNEFYIQTTKEILSVKEVYWTQGDLILFGHPPIGPLSQGELRNWILNVETSMMVKQFSSYDRTFDFRHPNVIRLSPVPTGHSYVIVEIETMQPEDLSGVPNDLEHYILELGLADAMIRIGSVRKKYGGNLRTPFGEIPLNSEIYEEGKEKKRDILEKLEKGFYTNIIFTKG